MRRLATWTVSIAMLWVSAFAISPMEKLHAQSLGFAGNTNSSDLYNNMPAWQGNNWLSNTFAPTQDWTLGVQTADYDIGVMLTQIAPNSAAARANLEVNDLVVAVGGQQVGIVDGRFVDFSSEIRRRADTSGNVSLLVQDGRTGRLTSIRVRLDGSNQSGLRGVIIRRDRSALPSDAYVTVSLENVTRRFYAVRNGEVSFPATAQNNIPFTINFDPTYIDQNDQYEVRAQIVSANRVIYRSQQPVRVLNGAPSDNVQLEVTPTQTVAAYPSSNPVIAASYGSSSVNDAYIAQYAQLYRRYLGNDLSPVQIVALQQSPNLPDISSVPLYLMASQQYYDAVGNNNALWITAVFQQIIGRTPSITERDLWIKYLSDQRGSRMEVLKQLANTKR